MAAKSQRKTIAADYAARDARVGGGFAVTAACIAAVTSTTCVVGKGLTALSAWYQLASDVRDLEILRSVSALSGDTGG